MIKDKYKAKRFPVFALVCLLLAACSGKTEAGTVIAGSTSVQPYAELLAEEYVLRYPECEIDIQGGGSSAGITAALSGVADIGMSSRDLNANETDLWSVEIARDGLAIIVNPVNPAADISPEHLRGIYTAEISNWAALGGDDAKIHIIAREEGSGTRSAFESLVMGDKFITPKAIIQDSNGAVKQLVSDDPHAIGFISLGLVEENVKALSLDGQTPSWENISNGSYSLFRPFLFITPAEPEGLTKQFVDFTLSEEGQILLKNQGLIPPGGR